MSLASMSPPLRRWPVLVAALAVVALALPAAARTLTVDQAVALALDHSLSIDAAEAGAEAARAQADEALLAFFPKASLSAGYTRLDQVPYVEFDTSAFLGGDDSGTSACDDISADDLPVGFTYEMAVAMCEMIMAWMTPDTGGDSTVSRIEMGLQDNYFAKASLEQIIFAGGALHQGRAATLDMHRASQQQVRMARHETVLMTEQGFYQLLAIWGAERVTQQAVDLVQAYVTDLENLVEVGIASRADLLAAQVQLSQAKLDSMKMSHMANLAEVSFKVMLGLPQGEPLELVMDDSPSLNDLPGDRDELLAMALQQRPDLAGLDHTLDAMKHGANATWASWLPAVIVMGNINWKNPNYALEPEWYRSGDVTVAMSWSIWDRGAALTRNRAVRAQRRQLESQRDMLAEMMTVELEAAITSFDEAVAQRDVASEGLERARESLRLEQERFREGVANNTQLLQAQTDLAGSELAVLQAETQMRTSYASLRKAVGMEPEVTP